MKAIKLKVKYSRLEIICQALLDYSDHCVIMTNTSIHNIEENYQIRLSIATELYYSLKKQMDKRYPAETYKIPLELHQAIVLQCALLRFVDSNENIFQKNAMEIVKNALNAEIVNLSKTVTPANNLLNP